MVNYPNKQIRLQNYNYSQPGYYFVTICAKNRVECFGNVNKGIISLNQIGGIAEIIWRQIPSSYTCIALDKFIIMPNHLHGIIIIQSDNGILADDGTPRRAATGLHSLIPNSLPSIINHYKGAVKKQCNKNGFMDFQWQSRFCDHVIRKDESLDKIREYISNNPLKWELDRNNPSNLWM